MKDYMPQYAVNRMGAHSSTGHYAKNPLVGGHPSKEPGAEGNQMTFTRRSSKKEKMTIDHVSKSTHVPDNTYTYEDIFKLDQSHNISQEQPSFIGTPFLKSGGQVSSATGKYSSKQHYHTASTSPSNPKAHGYYYQTSGGTTSKKSMHNSGSRKNKTS